MDNTLVLQRVHPFKREQVERVLSDRCLRESCEELWIFGSTIQGASDKRHNAFSDIDFAVLPAGTDTPDIDTSCCRTINERLMEDLTVDGRFTEYDIVWLNRLPSEALKANIKRGLRVF